MRLCPSVISFFLLLLFFFRHAMSPLPAPPNSLYSWLSSTPLTHPLLTTLFFRPAPLIAFSHCLAPLPHSHDTIKRLFPPKTHASKGGNAEKPASNKSSTSAKDCKWRANRKSNMFAESAGKSNKKRQQRTRLQPLVHFPPSAFLFAVSRGLWKQ